MSPGSAPAASSWTTVAGSQPVAGSGPPNVATISAADALGPIARSFTEPSQAKACSAAFARAGS